MVVIVHQLWITPCMALSTKSLFIVKLPSIRDEIVKSVWRRNKGSDIPLYLLGPTASVALKSAIVSKYKSSPSFENLVFQSTSSNSFDVSSGMSRFLVPVAIFLYISFPAKTRPQEDTVHFSGLHPFYQPNSHV